MRFAVELNQDVVKKLQETLRIARLFVKRHLQSGSRTIKEK